MEPLILIAIVVGIGWWLYRSGKRTGSRKGYNVGRAHSGDVPLIVRTGVGLLENYTTTIQG